MTIPKDKYRRRICANPVKHRPVPTDLQRHHILPQSWGGKATWNGISNTIDICGTCHDGGHTALNACVDYGGIPPWAVWKVFPPFQRWLAKEAIRRHGGTVPHIFTLAPPAPGSP
jgi:hypothetical protein